MNYENITLDKSISENSETYNAYYEGNLVGYIRLKYGILKVEYPYKGGEVIYRAFPSGNSSFAFEDEKILYLTRVKEAIAKKINNPEGIKAEEPEKLQWQTREMMDSPTNPLQYLVEVLSGTSRDCSEDKMIAAMYGIICGWDNAAYEELKVKHNWTDQNIEYQKMLHENYNKAWNLLIKDLNKKQF